MPRKFAGIMALIGMTIILVKALRNGDHFEAAIVAVLAWTCVMGTVGLVVGAIAQSTIDEAVRLHMEQELAAKRTTGAND